MITDHQMNLFARLKMVSFYTASAGSGLRRRWCVFLKGNYTVRNNLPRCLGAHKDVMADFYLGVSIYAPESQSVNSTVMNSAQCGATPTAETQTEPVTANVGR